MVYIYCIEDIHGKKYVGKTQLILKRRLQLHKANKDCYSNKLDLTCCKIYVLEECNNENEKEKEKEWINKIDCVNKYKYNFDKKESNKRYYYNTLEYQKSRKIIYNNKNKQNKREYDKKRNNYINSWGSLSNNNLLKIDVNLFL